MLNAETRKKKRFSVKEWSWIMYDWANSIYATNIMAAIFPTIFVSIAGADGDIWWGYGTSIATFIVAILAPLLGAVADFKGMKKKLFTVSMLMGVVFTFAIALVMNNWKLMLAGYILSRIGFLPPASFMIPSSPTSPQTKEWTKYPPGATPWATSAAAPSPSFFPSPCC